MAGKKKNEQAKAKSTRSAKRKIEDNLPSNKGQKVNKLQVDSGKGKKMKKSANVKAGSAKNSEENENFVSTFVEEEQIMEMEVDVSQDDFENDEEKMNMSRQMDDEATSDEEDFEQTEQVQQLLELGEQQHRNNNATIVREGKASAKKQNQLITASSDLDPFETIDSVTNEHDNELDEHGNSISREEKDEIIGEAYDKAMSKMKQCMAEVIAQSGFLENAQRIQDQLKKGDYRLKDDNARMTTINIKNQA